jgi:uncharacterized membrane protein
MSPELTTFLSAMIPVTELRGTIPFATTILGLPKETAFLYAVAGNMVPAVILLKLLDPIASFLMKHSKFFHKFFTKLFAKTRKKHSKKFERYEALFLPLFVAIPLPGSGAWTGVLISFVFGIPYLKSLVLIGIGVIISGIIMTVGTVSLISLFNVLL